jgi:hypothetical protein
MELDLEGTMRNKLLLLLAVIIGFFVCDVYTDRVVVGVPTSVGSLPGYGDILSLNGLAWSGDVYLWDGKKRLLMLRGVITEAQFSKICSHMSLSGAVYDSGFDRASDSFGYPSFEPYGESGIRLTGNIKGTRKMIVAYFQPLSSSVKDFGVMYLHCY